ncbi:MAG: tetratricopeptide repeat protein [Burkholderiaceae bacterium]|nr:MAG: tetratricopeptide repeat protein [Burkholderiaceae bacterium]
MAYNLEEQEQLDALKDWWKQYGNLVITVATIALFAFSGYMGWKWYQRTQAAEAAQMYEALQKAAELKDVGKIKAASAVMFEKYGSTLHAQYAALLAAKALSEAKDDAAAKTQLQWLVAHAKEEEFQDIARLRLAGLLLDEKAYDEGLKLLAIDPPAPFVALFADLRGDLLAAQNKSDEARSAYEQALAVLKPEDGLRGVIELKRDALGAPAK